MPDPRNRGPPTSSEFSLCGLMLNARDGGDATPLAFVAPSPAFDALLLPLALTERKNDPVRGACELSALRSDSRDEPGDGDGGTGSSSAGLRRPREKSDARRGIGGGGLGLALALALILALALALILALALALALAWVLEVMLAPGLGARDAGEEFGRSDACGRANPSTGCGGGVECTEMRSASVLRSAPTSVLLRDPVPVGVPGGESVIGMSTASAAVGGLMPVTSRMKSAIARKQYFAGVVKEKRIGRTWAASVQ